MIETYNCEHAGRELQEVMLQEVAGKRKGRQLAIMAEVRTKITYHYNGLSCPHCQRDHARIATAVFRKEPGARSRVDVVYPHGANENPREFAIRTQGFVVDCKLPPVRDDVT